MRHEGIYQFGQQTDAVALSDSFQSTKVDKTNKLKRNSKSMDSTEMKRSNFERVEHLCVRFGCSYLHS